MKDKIYEQLEEVLDPELGVDIVNLGLVYDVDIDEENNITITMTMTSMGCPLAPQIVTDVKYALSKIPEVQNVDVNIVWNPPWSKDRMSRFAKIALGVPE